MSSILYTSLSHCIGETFESLQYLYRIPPQTIGKIVPETCVAIVNVLSGEYLRVSQ